MNDLLRRGLELRRLADGTVVVPASARSAAQEVADRYGVRFGQAPRLSGEPVDAGGGRGGGGGHELFSLWEMGFDVGPVSTATLDTASCARSRACSSSIARHTWVRMVSLLTNSWVMAALSSARHACPAATSAIDDVHRSSRSAG